MKLIITESQQRYIKKRITERNLRMYVLDWDDNILNMPTKIYLKSDNGNSIGMSTHEFAHFRHLIGSEPFKYNGEMIVGFDENPFRDFTSYDTFLEDTKEAIDKKDFAPSINKFIETLIYGNPFAINTARGHNPEAIKEGVRLFIDEMLTDSQKEEMVRNIKDSLEYEGDSEFFKLDELNDDQIIDLYLDEKGEYYPVSSKEFGQRFDLPVSGGAANPEHSKKVALAHFLKKVFSNAEKLVNSGKYTKVSMGFSDDDIRNVKAMVEFIEDELSKLYPEVHFVVYDTSEGGNKKLILSKEY
jgi:hypothetical protein